MRKIEFWYSIGSTYTYLSTQRLAQIETENEVVFEWSPFSVRSRMIEMENVPFMAEKKEIRLIICGGMFKEELTSMDLMQKFLLPTHLKSSI